MLAQNYSSVTFNGNVTEAFGDVQNITVPVGTYRVFSVDVSGANLTLITNLPPPVSEPISENFTLNGQLYLEYGTCRLIQTNLQMNMTYSQGTQTTDELLSEQVKLVEHIKP
jgi:hypothetical protein